MGRPGIHARDGPLAKVFMCEPYGLGFKPNPYQGHLSLTNGSAQETTGPACPVTNCSCKDRINIRSHNRNHFYTYLGYWNNMSGDAGQQQVSAVMRSFTEGISSIEESPLPIWAKLEAINTVMGTWFALIIFPCVASIQHWCVPRSVTLDSQKSACFRESLICRWLLGKAQGRLRSVAVFRSTAAH